MSDRRCIYCGRLTELEKDVLFRLPPDHPRTYDASYADFRRTRGEQSVRADLPAVCGSRSPECAKLEWENGKPVLITKTGRSTDTLICPTCHSELFRDTDSGSVHSAVFFGEKDSGKTSLILALADRCITGQFSPDEKYRYIFNDRLYDTALITSEHEKAAAGGKPADLREPAAVYRVSRADEGGKAVCDVMYDVSENDTADEEALLTALPFAASAEHFVYCIPADRLREALASDNEGADIRMKKALFMMMSAFRFSEKPPELDIAVTKSDLAGSDIGDYAECVRRAYPSIKGLEMFFSGIKVYPVSAKIPENGGEDLAGQLYAGLFG